MNSKAIQRHFYREFQGGYSRVFLGRMSEASGGNDLLLSDTMVMLRLSQDELVFSDRRYFPSFPEPCQSVIITSIRKKAEGPT